MSRPILKFKNNGNRSRGSGVAAVESRGMFLTLFLTDAAQPEPLVYQKLQIIDPVEQMKESKHETPLLSRFIDDSIESAKYRQ